LQSNSKKVLSFIQKNPGCYLRQIKRDLNISMGSVQYHSYQLQRQGKISFVKQGIHKFHFAAGIYQDKEKKVLQILNQETPREILLFIAEQKNISQSEIVKKLGISAPSINWHIKRLIALNIIDQIKDGKFRRYKLHDDDITVKYILELSDRRRPSMWDKWSNRMLETFLSLSTENE
jgi:predicted transcriptional regulator